jgi:4-amino-4-deoxy-L-arabinose transferase-like glycosyltransferase
MNKLNKTLPVAALLGLCALIFFLRLHTYEEPLERDLTTYAVIAHEMLNGKTLYTDLWDHKPPAIYVTYAAAELIAGYGRDAIFLMNVSAGFATLLACYFAGSAAGGGRLGGLIAATLWVLASGDLAIEGNQPNTEVFLNAVLTWGFAILMRAEKPNLGLRAAVLTGLFFAIASLYKHVAVVEAALLALAYFAWPTAGSRKQALANVAVIAGIGAVAWGLVFTYFAAQGRGNAFTEAVFTYNGYYSGSIWQNLGHVLSWPRVSADVLAALVPLAILSLGATILGLIFGPRRPWIFLLTFAIATHIAVLLPGRFFPHYYQLWLPPLAIGTGWAVALLKRILPASLSHLSYGVAGVACAVLIALELPYYRLSAADWSAQKYGNIFLETDKLAYKIDNLLSPGETFYEWGNESGFCFSSRHRPSSGVFLAEPMLVGPLIAKLSRRLIDDLERTRPELIVVDGLTLAHTPRGSPVLKWFEENYRPFSKTGMFPVRVAHPAHVILAKDQFLLFALKGGKLDAQKPDAGNETAKSLPVVGIF